MKTQRFARRSRRGFSMVELVISSAGVLVVLAVAVPAFQSIQSVSDEGQTRLRVQSETRHALIRMARELENTSTTAVDGAGNPRLTIADGEIPDAMVDDRYSANPRLYMGGFAGRLGDDTDISNNSVDDDTDDSIGGLGTGANGNAREDKSKGTGQRGGSHHGRIRQKSNAGSEEISTNSFRPRHAQILTNSVLTFETVTGYTIDANNQPVVQWSQPIEYRVEQRKLVRVQGADKRVVCPTCVGFQVQLTDAGSVMLTVVSQARTKGRARIQAAADMIEVSPKN